MWLVMVNNISMSAGSSSPTHRRNLQRRLQCACNHQKQSCHTVIYTISDRELLTSTSQRKIVTSFHFVQLKTAPPTKQGEICLICPLGLTQCKSLVTGPVTYRPAARSYTELSRSLPHFRYLNYFCILMVL